MIKLPLRVRPEGYYRPKVVLDADGNGVSLESLVGIVGALLLVLNAAKIARDNRVFPPGSALLDYAINTADTVLYGETQLGEQRVDEEESN